MRWWVIGSALLAVLAGGAARADIYDWVDESGTSHFANDMQSIPEERRPSARVMLMEKPGAAGDAKAAAPAAPGVVLPSARPVSQAAKTAVEQRRKRPAGRVDPPAEP